MIKRKLTIILAVLMMMLMLPFHSFAQEDIPDSSETAQTENEVVHPDGWDGQMYYKNGQPVKGAVYIKGNSTVTKKVKYYYNKKKKKWQTKKIKNAKTKYKKVKKTVDATNLYLFDKNGKLVVKNKDKIFNHDGKEYYSLGNGKLKTGWVAVGKKAMYFYRAKDSNAKAYSPGAMAKNTTIGHLKIPKSGRLGEAYALGVKKLNKSGWTLKKAFKNSRRLRYANKGYRAKNSETYAIRGFKRNKGNCYCYAGTFYIQAKLLGYDVHQVEGYVKIGSRSAAHSWTVIVQNGKEWVYDPEFAWQTGRNGYKIYYKKKGTWRYYKYHKMN